MITTRVYYSPRYGVISLLEVDSDFSELMNAIGAKSNYFWTYIGDL